MAVTFNTDSLEQEFLKSTWNVSSVFAQNSQNVFSGRVIAHKAIPNPDLETTLSFVYVVCGEVSRITWDSSTGSHTDL
jgi:hypothetical protein